jgi:hypothetical protein
VIRLSQRNVHLQGRADERVRREVEIRAELDRELDLQPLPFNLKEWVSFRLEEVEKGRRFKVILETVPGPAKNYRGHLRLKTNYPEKPELTIWIRGRIVSSDLPDIRNPLGEKARDGRLKRR